MTRKSIDRETAHAYATRFENWVTKKSWPFSDVSPFELRDELAQMKKTEYNGLDGFRALIRDLRAT